MPEKLSKLHQYLKICQAKSAGLLLPHHGIDKILIQMHCIFFCKNIFQILHDLHKEVVATAIYQ
jgi:hypothetical protein